MKLLVYYYLAIFAHFVFDLIWQGRDIAINKRGLNKQMLTHCLVMGISSGLVIAIYYQSISIFIQSSLFIGITHLIVDAVRVELNRKLKDKFSTPFWQYLGVDQILHTLAILLVFIYFN